MARIKIKLGPNEIEVDSRDFYVDNDSLSSVIENISNHLSDNDSSSSNSKVNVSSFVLDGLDDVEVFEPEFSQPVKVDGSEIRSKLQILQNSKFFSSPRTVSEVVQQLREYGWISSALDVSKALAKMALSKEINKNLDGNKTHYFLQEKLILN
jgi:transcription initiation factor IIE alpha subunit